MLTIGNSCSTNIKGHSIYGTFDTYNAGHHCSILSTYRDNLLMNHKLLDTFCEIFRIRNMFWCGIPSPNPGSNWNETGFHQFQLNNFWTRLAVQQDWSMYSHYQISAYSRCLSKRNLILLVYYSVRTCHAGCWMNKLSAKIYILSSKYFTIRP